MKKTGYLLVIISTAIFLLQLSGCGQVGALYLPDNEVSQTVRLKPAAAGKEHYNVDDPTTEVISEEDL